MQTIQKEMHFPTQFVGFWGKRYRCGFYSSPICLSGANNVKWHCREERFAQTGLLRCIISRANVSDSGLLSSLHTCCNKAGLKFMEFYWQVGVSCLQKLSSLISVPWCCGWQFHLAETNQKNSSSLRKHAGFMLNFIMLFFSTVNPVAFLTCGALSFYAFSL